MLFLTCEKICMYIRYESYATPGKKLIIQISVKGLSLKRMCCKRRKTGDLTISKSKGPYRLCTSLLIFRDKEMGQRS